MRVAVIMTIILLVVLVACRRASEPRAPVHHPQPASSEAAMAGHHRPHDMPHRFDDAQAWAEHFDDPQRDTWQRPDAVIEGMALAPDAVIADLGAGTGYFTVRLARAVPQGRVLAIDVEPDMVRYIEERAASDGLRNVIARRNASDDPGLTEAVDVVFACDVVHHIADRSRFFRAVTPHLREGGRVVIVDFRPDAPPDTPGPPARHRLSISTLEAELAPAGLRLDRADTTTLPYQYIATFVAM